MDTTASCEIKRKTRKRQEVDELHQTARDWMETVKNLKSTQCWTGRRRRGCSSPDSVEETSLSEEE